jgi:hypothetical protein
MARGVSDPLRVVHLIERRELRDPIDERALKVGDPHQEGEEECRQSDAERRDASSDAIGSQGSNRILLTRVVNRAA